MDKKQNEIMFTTLIRRQVQSKPQKMCHLISTMTGTIKTIKYENVWKFEALSYRGESKNSFVFSPETNN